MKEYKRLTNKNLDEFNPEHDFCIGCEFFGEPNGCNRWNGACANYEDFNELYNRLAELEDKIEDGTLIELPCKVGDTLYYVSPTKKQINIEKVTGIVLDEFLKIRTLSNQGILEYFPISFLGRTLLFTIAEAEAKLKELKNE